MEYYVYIMASKSKTLYIGVTNDLVRRAYEHRSKILDGFTKCYNVIKLVHYEVFADSYSAIAREKQLKGWLRRKKVSLIEVENPAWRDLAQGL